MADLVDARVLRTVATSELGTLSAAKPEKGSCADRERPVGRQSGARLVLALDLATSGSVLADNVPRVSGMLTKILLFTSHPAHSPRGSGLFFLGLFLNGCLDDLLQFMLVIDVTCTVNEDFEFSTFANFLIFMPKILTGDTFRHIQPNRK